MTVPGVTERIAGFDVRVSERRERPLVFLLRMASPEAGVWNTVWSDLERHFTVAAFDLQQLEKARAMRDVEAVFEAAARACVAIADAMERERFHLFGWNGGTHIALRAAVDHRERVVSLLLLDPFFELADMRHVEVAVRIKQLLFEQDRELYAYYWTMAGLSDGFVAGHFDRVEELVAGRLRSDRFIGQSSERFIRWVRALRRNWLSAPELRSIRAPTLILATGQDRWNAGPSVAMAEALHAHLEKSELEVIEGVGGHFLIEAPKRFAALVDPFLERHATP